MAYQGTTKDLVGATRTIGAITPSDTTVYDPVKKVLATGTTATLQGFGSEK